MQINEFSKECITHLEIEKIDGKNYIFLIFYNGVVCIYCQESKV